PANTPTVATTPVRGADQFTKSTYRFFDGLAKHQRGFAVAVIGAFVLLIVAALVMGQKDKASGEARNALFLAQKKFDTEMKALAPPAPIGDPKKDAKTPPAPPADDTEFKAFDVNAKLPET